MKRSDIFLMCSFVLAVCLVTVCISKIVAARMQFNNSQSFVFQLSSGVTTLDIIGSSPHLKGDTNAQVTLVEFGDYQCPPCQKAHQELTKLLNASRGRWKLVFRHFPLSMHTYSRDAACAAEAAGEQGKFWEMHDQLYKSEGKLASDDIFNYAEILHLDRIRFKNALTTSAKKRVRIDIAATERFKLEGTPTLLLCDADGSVRSVNLSQLKQRFP